MKACLALVVLALQASCAPCLSQTNSSSFYLQAGTNFANGDYKAAILNLTKALESDPRNATNFYARAYCEYFLGDCRSASADYSRAIEINPKCGSYYCGRGQCKFYLGDSGGALTDYNKAIELDPACAMAYFNRGNLRVHVYTNLTAAITDFDKALELHTDPREDDIFFCRGNAKADLKDFVGAIADYNKALQINPNYALVRTNLAIARDALRASKK